ncbi:hypothetical protein [Pseudomethylobacillus aquaticus]|uniref:hypothetical protein n=1 Tax=Pseudomethylobacillus aquaticus TaxID=2676064 RepID=UPI0011CD97F1|nr:hypothetical protein [Pseudomethylobacillus aquaticus]
MEMIFFWLIFSLIVGVYASNKGRSGVGFFVLSLIFSPILGLFFALVAKDLSKPKEPTSETHKKCPDCKELVLIDARICKHCRCNFQSDQEAIKAVTDNLVTTSELSEYEKLKKHLAEYDDTKST